MAEKSFDYFTRDSFLRFVKENFDTVKKWLQEGIITDSTSASRLKVEEYNVINLKDDIYINFRDKKAYNIDRVTPIKNGGFPFKIGALYHYDYNDSRNGYTEYLMLCVKESYVHKSSLDIRFPNLKEALINIIPDDLSLVVLDIESEHTRYFNGKSLHSKTYSYVAKREKKTIEEKQYTYKGPDNEVTEIGVKYILNDIFLNVKNVDDGKLWNAFFDLYRIFKRASIKSTKFNAAATDLENNILLCNCEFCQSDIIRPIFDTADQAFNIILDAFGIEINGQKEYLNSRRPIREDFDTRIYFFEDMFKGFPNLSQICKLLRPIRLFRNNESHNQMIVLNPIQNMKESLLVWVLMVYLLENEARLKPDTDGEILSESELDLFVPCYCQKGLTFVNNDIDKGCMPKRMGDTYYIRPFMKYSVKCPDGIIRPYNFTNLDFNTIDLIWSDGNIKDETSFLKPVDSRRKKDINRLLEELNDEMSKFKSETDEGFKIVSKLYEGHAKSIEANQSDISEVKAWVSSWEEKRSAFCINLEKKYGEDINSLYQLYSEMDYRVSEVEDIQKSHGNTISELGEQTGDNTVRIGDLTTAVEGIKADNRNFLQKIAAIISGQKKHGVEIEELSKDNKKNKTRISLIYGGLDLLILAISFVLFCANNEWMISEYDWCYELSQITGIGFRSDRHDIPFLKAKMMERKVIREFSQYEKENYHSEEEDSVFNDMINRKRLKMARYYKDAYKTYKKLVDEDHEENGDRAYRLAWMIATLRAGNNNKQELHKYDSLAYNSHNSSPRGLHTLLLLKDNRIDEAKYKFTKLDSCDIYYDLVKALLELREVKTTRSASVLEIRIHNSGTSNNQDVSDFGLSYYYNLKMNGVKNDNGEYLVDKDIMEAIGHLQYAITSRNSTTAMIELANVYEYFRQYGKAASLLAAAYCNGFTEVGHKIIDLEKQNGLSEDEAYRKWWMVKKTGEDRSAKTIEIKDALKNGNLERANTLINQYRRNLFGPIDVNNNFTLYSSFMPFKSKESLVEKLKTLKCRDDIVFTGQVDSIGREEAVRNYVVAAYMEYKSKGQESDEDKATIDSLLNISVSLGMTDAIVTACMRQYENNKASAPELVKVMTKYKDHSDNVKIWLAERLRLVNPNESRNIMRQISDQNSSYRVMREIDELIFSNHIKPMEDYEFQQKINLYKKRLNNGFSLDEYCFDNNQSSIVSYLTFLKCLEHTIDENLLKDMLDISFHLNPHSSLFYLPYTAIDEYPSRQRRIIENSYDNLKTSLYRAVSVMDRFFFQKNISDSGKVRRIPMEIYNLVKYPYDNCADLTNPFLQFEPLHKYYDNVDKLSL